jgi:predicted nucleic acid-binding protein
MQLIDSSAWIDFLRRSGAVTNALVAQALRDDSAATTDVVVLEVLSGTTDEERLNRWRRLFARCEFLEQRPRDDADTAAALYRTCRRAGETPRAPNDCLLAAVAIRCDVPVLHGDHDFDVIARHTDLQVVTA